MSRSDAAATLLREAIARGVFPAAVAEVGDRRGPIWSAAFGTLTGLPGAAAVTLDTRFDLASLTKPIATTSLALALMARGVIALDTPIASAFPEWRGADRESVTVRDLLEHAGGLSPRLLDSPPDTRREFEHEIATMPLAYAPRTQSVYTDLGFILLGFLLADAAGSSLDEQFSALVLRLHSQAADAPAHAALTFRPTPDGAALAPTSPLPEDKRQGRLLVGEVHDNYAAALGGVAGHAGLFGNVAGVALFARACLRGAAGEAGVTAPGTAAQMALAMTPSRVPGSSRALGWDTMRPTSSCGTRMSPAAVGHVGFTGVSLWIDPLRDRYYALLTNRVCGNGSSDDMQAVRRAFHDAVADL